MSQKKKKVESKDHFFEDIMKGIKGLKDSEFEIEKVKFQIKKLSPIAGFHLFEKIRYELSVNADTAEAQPDSPLLFFKAVLTLEPDVIEDIRNILFKNISFRGNGVETGWMDLDGSEEMAFQNMEPVHIYELLIRSLSVNFTGSFHAIASKFPGMKRILSRSKR